MIKKLLNIALIIFMNFFTAVAQQDMTMHFMRQLPQASYTNPAFVPAKPYKFHIGMPALSSIYLNVGNSGFRYSDFIHKNEQDSLFKDFDNLLEKLKPRNYLSMNLHLDIINFGFRLKKNYFGFNITEKINFQFTYPKDLIGLVWYGNGNAAYLDKAASFDGIGINFIHYREYALNYSREIDEKWTAGIRVKYLAGMMNLWTEKSDISLTTTEPRNTLTVNSSYAVHTTGLGMLTNDSMDFDPKSYALNNNNKGFGIDLGGIYKVNEKIEVSAAVNDLGYIKWTDDVKTYYNDSATFVYDGIELNAFMKDGDFQNNLTKITDSLQRTFEAKETNEAYKSPLSTKLYVSGTYKVIKSGTAGLLFYGNFLNKKFMPAVSLNYTHNVKNWLSASVSYSILNRGYANVGFGLFLKATPINFYIISDNLLGAIFPQHTRTAHVRLGIQFIFGKEKSGSDAPKTPID